MVHFAGAQDFDRLRAEVRQQQEQTRRDINFLRTEINRMETELQTTATEYDQQYRQFTMLERELELRNQVVQNLQEQESQINRELSILRASYEEYVSDLERLRENYKTILRQQYMHGRESEIVLMLTSGSLNEAQTRSYYLRRFHEHRENQARQIQNAIDQIQVKEEEMEDARSRNAEVLAEAQQERRQMQQRRNNMEQMVTRLQQDRRSLEQRLSQTRADIENLNQTITDLIAREEQIRREEEERFRLLEEERLRRLADAQLIQNAREREREIARFSQPIERPEAATMSNEELASAESAFRSSKGRLRWPVNSGAISNRFGNVLNPVYRTTLPNYGIEITTTPRAEVYAVHEGYVVSINSVPYYGTLILVNHGNYITAYGNLTDVFVRPNSVVRAGDLIGLGGDNDSSLGAAVFFLIRDGNRNVDPEEWLGARPGPNP